ncbi:universal stress protein [Bacillus sp. EB600]|uniref:universal stress protein n=1 Tax=Bacillus sp. EB600 TaxID=2806345 RepID=UPI00210CC124|nr:universal stress protein [Bacillus sp. EB600]MCQ6279262.1 universal stress protein [Bacillus sp. EB600]
MLTIFSRIVIPYDHSPLSKKALETVINLAKQDIVIELDIITVVHVTMPSSYYVAFNVEDEVEAQIKEAKKNLNEAEKYVKDHLPNRVSTFVLEGTPAEMIVEFVKQNDADLVVMGSRGLSGLKELFLGSVSHNVVQKSPCPVFIIK